MSQPIIEIEHLRKEFSFTSPSAGFATDDMWIDYILGLIGKSKSFAAAQRKHTVAVDDVSLTVEPGELFGLLGPNGAGKTTLIKLLATVLRPTSGAIRINGFDTVRQAARARASLNVVAASGWFAFDMQLTLTQNLVFWGRLCGLDRAIATSRALDALEIVALAEWRDETPNNLSSGMRQRLALAKGLLVKTPVFLLDEPTANVDPLIGYQIRDFLRNDLNRDLGQTIVLATHNMGEAQQLCDRVAIVNAGRILACDRPDRLTRLVAGRVVEIAVPTGANTVLAILRERGIARQLADTLAEDGSGTIRAHLTADATRDSLAALLPTDATITDLAPTLEDVFVHVAGRTINEPETDVAAA